MTAEQLIALGVAVAPSGLILWILSGMRKSINDIRDKMDPLAVNDAVLDRRVAVLEKVQEDRTAIAHELHAISGGPRSPY